MSDKSVEDDMRELLAETNTSSNNQSFRNERPSGIISQRKRRDMDELEEGFDWQRHLTLYGGVPAPDDCFFQTTVPPINKFEEGKKLVMPDLRGGGGTLCLATIEGVYGVWICLRLDGCDRSNDQWVICDDTILHPLRFQMSVNAQLQPPVGFRPNMSQFHRFIENQLKPNETGDSIASPDDCFCPISDDYCPRENKFQVGHKVEACDMLNFNGKCAPATVVAVDGDMVELNFDGWQHVYNIKEKYYSRNLFPVGWSDRARLDIQPPKKIIGKIKAKGPSTPVTPKASDMDSDTRSTSSRTKSGRSEARNRKGHLNQQKKSFIDRLKQGNLEDTIRRLKEVDEDLPSMGLMSPPTPPLPSYGRKKAQQSSNIVISKMSSDKNEKKDGDAICGTSAPGETSKKELVAPARARKTFVASKKTMQVAKKEKKKREQQVQSAAREVTRPTTADIVLGGASTCSPSAQQMRMVVYVNRSCVCGSLLDSDKVNALPTRIGPANFHHVLRETVQYLVNSAIDVRSVFFQVPAGSPRIITITAEMDGVTRSRALPALADVSGAWAYLRHLLHSLATCPNLLSSEHLPCNNCVTDNNIDDSGKSISKTERSFSSNDHSNIGLTSCSKQESPSYSRKELDLWTIEDVADCVAQISDASIASKFRANQIDGKALTLLSTDLIIKHMEVAFGPSLKIMAFIESLKKRA